MRGRLQRKLNNKSGFTLAETLVALAISIILLAITMVGILHYYKNMKLTEMDNTAKEIFIAAQNHLTAADASGELKRYRETALDDSKTEVKKEALGQLIGNEPSDVPEGIDWPADNREYYYIEYNTNTSGSIGNLEGSILQYMLPFGAIDETVRADGRYIIEYNVETATVYGVFYAEEDVDFDYLDIAWLDKNGGRTDDAKGRHTRRDYDKGIIGYYGGAMADLLPSAPTDELTMEILNEDTLKIVLRDFNYFKKANDGTIAKTHITFSVEGKESKNIEEFTLSLTDDGSNPKKKNEKEQKWWTVEKKTTADRKPIDYLEYTITLDDITRPGGHFANICPTLLPGEDIIVKAVSQSDSVLATVREAQGMTNSLFEAVTPDEKEKKATASIGYLRHFENLDSSVSNLPNDINKKVNVNGKTYQAKYLVTKAVQTRDMGYHDFFGKDKENRKSVYAHKDSKETDQEDIGKLSDKSFYGIRNDYLREYDGQNFKISDVYIDNKNEDVDKDESKGTIGILGAVNGALIRYCSKPLSISDLTLKDFDVTTKRNAAALIAEMNAGDNDSVTTLEISNVLVVGGEIKSTYGRGNAGGLIGYTGANTVVTNCAANTKVIANGPRLKIDYAGDAGGLIGEIKAVNHTISIANCYTGGQTVNGKYKFDRQTDFNVYGVDTAGGLIGKLNRGANTSIKDCYSTCSVYIADDENGLDYGCAGGLIGKQREGNSAYESCYATGLVDGDIGSMVGTFIGKCTLSDTFKDCYVLDGISERPVSASNYKNTAEIKTHKYDNMPKNSGNVTTHPTDKKLKDKVYPFVTVNTVGRLSSDDVNSTGVHYGDWQEPEEKEQIGDRSFAYCEKINGTYYWYIVTANEDENGNTTFSVINTLKTDKNTKVDDKEYSYGILLPESEDKKNLNGHFSGGDIKKWIDKNAAPDPVDIKMTDGTIVKYNYYQVKDYPADQRDKKTGVVKFLTWKKSGKESKGEDVIYYFNPDFAAAISANDEEILGTSVRPYQVRTNKQLKNINSNDYLKTYIDCYYRQTVDIDLVGDNFTALGGTEEEAFSGQYNAFWKNGEGYDINKFNQEIKEDSSANPGLFAEISVTAKISYINLHGEMEVKSEKCGNIGSLSGMLRGNLNNCKSDVSMKAEIDEEYSGNIGGLVGTSVGGSKIDNCHYAGKKFDMDLEKVKTANIGGLVGDHSGKMILSSSDIKKFNIPELESDDKDESGVMYIGGLIGEANMLTDVNTSWAKVSFKGEVEDAKGNIIIGGFVGRIFGEAEIKNCYAAFRTDKIEDEDNDHKVSVDTGFKQSTGSTLTIRAFAGFNEKIGEEGEAGSISYCHAVMLDEDEKRKWSDYHFIGGEKLIKTAVCFMSGEGETSIEDGVRYIDNYHNFTANFAKFKYKNEEGKEITIPGLSDSIWKIKDGTDNSKRWPVLIDNPET